MKSEYLQKFNGVQNLKGVRFGGKSVLKVRSWLRHGFNMHEGEV